MMGSQIIAWISSFIPRYLGAEEYGRLYFAISIDAITSSSLGLGSTILFVKEVARGQVLVIPLKIGGGIRGKALEAMAMRSPIVTTTLGCEEMNLAHQDSALFADTPQDFADAVVRLFRDAELRERLTEKAFKNVVEGYSRDVNGRALDSVYRSLVDMKAVHAPGGARATTR